MALFGLTGSKSKQKVDQTTTSNPYGPAAPGLEQLFAEATRLFGDSSGNAEYYPGQQVADISPNQQAAIDLAMQMASGGNPALDAAGTRAGELSAGTTDEQALLRSLIGSSATEEEIINALKNFNAASGDQTGIQRLQELASGTSSPVDFNNAGRSYLEDFAQGNSYDPTLDTERSRGYLESIASNTDFANDPILQGAIDSLTKNVTQAFNREVLPGVQSQFAAAGRYGSSGLTNAINRAQEGAAGQLTSGVADLVYKNALNQQQQRLAAAQSLLDTDLSTSQLRQQAKDSELARRLTAGQSIADLDLATDELQQNAFDADQSRRLSAASALESARQNTQGLNLDALTSALSGEQSSRQLSSGNAQALLDSISSGTALASDVANSQVANLQTNLANLLATGQIQADQAQAIIDANREQFDFGQNADFERLSRLAAILSAASPYASSNTQGTTKSKSAGFSIG